MPYVTCPCGVRLLYRDSPDGPIEHWSRQDVEKCLEVQVSNGDADTSRCSRINRQILDNFVERREQIIRLRGRARRVAMEHSAPAVK